MEEIIFYKNNNRIKCLNINLQEFYRISIPKTLKLHWGVYKKILKNYYAHYPLVYKGDNIVISFLNYSIG